jgi:uncharacterized Rmd1/YagE family protein
MSILDQVGNLNRSKLRSNSVPNRRYLDKLYHDSKGNHIVEQDPLIYAEVLTDEEVDYGRSSYDYIHRPTKDISNKLVKTGRQRKRLAARSKYSEFQAKLTKRRVYFCCVSSEIDVHKLLDFFVETRLNTKWKYRMYNDVLHIYKPTFIDDADRSVTGVPLVRSDSLPTIDLSRKVDDLDSDHQISDAVDEYRRERKPSIDDDCLGRKSAVLDHILISAIEPSLDHLSNKFSVNLSEQYELGDTDTTLSGLGTQEVFVFEFGACVFWGFNPGEEILLLKTIRLFCNKGIVGPLEFEEGEDDMAFVTAPDVQSIRIANDLITLPDNATALHRLGLSFAIAQSAILSIFEARIEKKVEDYKYIPGTLAKHGKVHLTETELAIMMGEVFVIRHDVNLHTEILDIPDFFWDYGDILEHDYKLVSKSIIDIIHMDCYIDLIYCMYEDGTIYGDGGTNRSVK